MRHSIHTARKQGITGAMAPDSLGNSGARLQMCTTEFSQAVSPGIPDIPTILSSSEEQLADYTIGCVAPEKLEVVKIINLHNGHDGIENNLTTVIYRSLEHDSRRDQGVHYGSFNISLYSCQEDKYHETFMHRFRKTDLANMLSINTILEKGDVLTLSPNIDDNGYYSNTVELETVYLPLPSTTEDGFKISESTVKRLSPTAYGDRVVSLGRNKILINLHGSDKRFKGILDIGDVIPESGLVFATRDLNEEYYGLDLTNAALQQPAYNTDRLYYGKVGAKIWDVSVDSSITEFGSNAELRESINAQLLTYESIKSNYYNNIVETVENLTRYSKGVIVNLLPELQNLTTTALAARPNYHIKRLRPSNKGKKNNVLKAFKAEPLDEFRITVRFMYTFKIGRHAKLADKHGGKGVICEVTPDADMPALPSGHSADIVIYGRGVIARMNIQQLPEHYIKATLREATKRITNFVDNGDYDSAWDLFTALCAIVSPTTLKDALIGDQDERDALMDSIADDKMYIVKRPDEFIYGTEIIEKIEAICPPERDYITYTDIKGNIRTTVDKTIIGAKSFMVLDKSDNKDMSVGSVLRQHHGLPAVQNKATLFSSGNKKSPLRSLAESEVRAGSSIVGGDAISNILNLSSNPDLHKFAVRTMYEAEDVENIENVTNEEAVIKDGNSLKYLKTILGNSGIEITKDFE